ncbi:MAG: hypothetical protein H8M99_00280 [Gloeobacteraceae cyanobacterium ES-bin-144]|nr:hypothetical protein [Verrucomicrobiales bacterium]
MSRRFHALLFLLTLALSPCLHASGKADSKAAISFHLETEASDNPKMIFPQMANGKTRYFRRMPEVTTKDIASFRSFPSDTGGDDYGVIFSLKENAAKRLAAITNVAQGKYLISRINGQVNDGVLIDKQIDDGYLVIWRGITLAGIKGIEKSIPLTGQNK